MGNKVLVSREAMSPLIVFRFAGITYRIVPYRMRLKRRRAHTAIWRTEKNQKTRQTDRLMDGRIVALLCASHRRAHETTS